MNRRLFGSAGLGLVAAFAAGRSAHAAAAAGGNAAAFQVSSDDRKTQALILGNVHNYASFYKGKGESFAIEIVAFGPGFSMVRGDMSMMKGEMEALRGDLGSALIISACANTRAAIAESEGKAADAVPLLPGVTVTPSGVVRLAELQRQGWAYLRP